MLEDDRPFRIQDCLVEPGLNRIKTPQGVLQLEPKFMQVLVCLVSEPGRVWSRQELLQRVWQDTYVTDDVLTRAVSELRKVFHDNPHSPHLIETIRKRGYRFIGAAEPIQARDPGEQGGGLAQEPTRSPKHRRKPLLVATLAGLVAVAAAGTGLYLAGRRDEAAGTTLRVRPLTSYPGWERDAAFSPDGSRVAFTWKKEPADSFNLYVKGINQDVPLQLTRSRAKDRSPAWSADGRTIAFFRLEGRKKEIWTVPSAGGPAQKLLELEGQIGEQLSWSPDGRWLALSHRSSLQDPFQIELISPQSLERHQITFPSRLLLGDFQPSFSPDGRRLAFTRAVSPQSMDIFTLPLAGGEPQRVTSDHRDIIDHDWTDDGKSIVFSSNRGGGYALWEVAARGGDPRPLLISGWKLKHPATSHSRPLLAYENWLYEKNIWAVKLNPSNRTETASAPSRIIASTQWDLCPRLAPDGRRLAFVSTRSGSYELWLSPLKGGQARRLTSIEGAFVGPPAWSPDGRRIVFSARPGTHAQLFVIDAEGTGLHQLTHDAFEHEAPAWSRDGRSIYFASNRTGSWQVWKTGSGGGTSSQVTRLSGFSARESVNGRRLFFSRLDAAGIWEMPVSGGTPQRIVPTLDPSDWGNWQVTSRGIYSVRPAAGGESELDFFDFASGQTRAVTELVDLLNPGLTISADGRLLLFSRADASTCDLVLVENVH